MRLFCLALTWLLSGVTAFLGWFLKHCATEYDVPLGGWSIFFYITAAVVAVAGVLDFLIFICRVCKHGARRRRRR